jgi:gamma-glutamyltranspeptidase/glutathione hydrolase
MSHFPSSFYPHEMFPKKVSVEGRIPADVVDELRRRGHEVDVLTDWAMGEITAIRFHPDTGLIEGAASPRARAAYAMGR